MTPPITTEDHDKIDAFIGVRKSLDDDVVPEVHELRFERIVLAHDGSDRAEKALEWAAWFAEHMGSEIHIISVVAPPPYLYDVGLQKGTQVLRVESYKHISEGEEQAAQGILEAAAARLFERIPKAPESMAIETYVRHGAPAIAIATLAEEIGADLIVMGSHGHGAFERFFLGSVTDSVNDRAPCSLLIAKDVPGVKGGVLVPTEGSPAARRAVRAAAKIAEQTGRSLDLLHIVEAPHLQHPQHGAAYYRDLAQFTDVRHKEAQDLAFQGDVQVHVAAGRPQEATLRFIEKAQPALVVTGSRGIGHVLKLVIGSMARTLAHRTPGSIMIVKE